MAFVISIPIPNPILNRILNKRSRNLVFYYVNEHTSPCNYNFSETSHNNFSFNTSGDITETTFPATLQTSSKTRERSTSINPISNLQSGLRFHTVKVQTQFMKKKLRFKVFKTTFYKIF